MNARGLTDHADLYRSMATIRQLEETVRDLRVANEFTGSVHLEIGQEAVAVGVCAALNIDDPVYATYRGHGWATAAGVDPTALLAELLGRAGGVNAGRGGSACFSDRASWFMGENSIVGGGAPIAVGAALAARFQNSGRVAVCVFGDGATNQGAVHESLNMAAAMKLPIVFVCENNVYSELTPIAETTGDVVLHERAAAYGMSSTAVDGNDVIATRAVALDAVKRARSGDGPTFIEAHTYRLCGHYIGDPEQYRTAEEIEQHRADEPLEKSRRALGAGVTEPIDQQVATEISAAVQAARSQPLADPQSVHIGVYAEAAS